jgi:hypothetical protein
MISDIVQYKHFKIHPLHAGGHTDVTGILDPHIGVALLCVLPPTLASIIGSIGADRDAERLERAVAALVRNTPGTSTSAS